MRRLRIVLAAAALFYAAFILRSLFVVDGSLYATLFDDAMISMRYARNFALGHGLVWNPGGPAVEGFTNPVWTVVMAVVHAAGVPSRIASLPMMVIGALLLLFTSMTAFRLARELTEDEGIAVGAAALTAFGYALVFWTLRGMEVGLLAALIAYAAARAIAFVRDGRTPDLVVVAIALAGAMWTRADALVPAAILAAYMCWRAPTGRRTIAIAACATFLIIGAAVPLLWSRWYYGQALPNTYYLKIDGTPAARRLARGIPAILIMMSRGLAAALIPAGAALLPRGARRAKTPEYVLLAALVAGQCAYSAYVGGDAWEWMGYPNRYVSIVVPILAVLMAVGIRVLLQTRRASIAAAFALASTAVLHSLVVLVLMRRNRGVEAASVEAYRNHPALIVGLVAAAGVCMIAVTVAATARRSFAGVCLAVWLLTSGVPAVRWVFENAFSLPEDQRAARMGLVLRDALAPDASFAVSWAGSIPYFADHHAIDLLGKTDAVIARLPPVIPEFVPGHNKWNLRYSIGELKPDLACNLPRRPGDVEYLLSQHYRGIGWTCFVKKEARLDERRLKEGLRGIYGEEPPIQAEAR